MISYTTIVYSRSILLEWIHRNENDQRTYGKLFFMFCDKIQDMDLISEHVAEQFGRDMQYSFYDVTNYYTEKDFADPDEVYRDRSGFSGFAGIFCYISVKVRGLS